MSGNEYAVMIAFGVFGFVAVYWLMSYFGKSTQPSIPTAAETPSHAASPITVDAPWWEVLGLDENCTREDLENAYVAKRTIYSYKNIKDFDDDMKEISRRKIIEIVDAYKAGITALNGDNPKI